MISVVIPFYNKSNFIERAIASCLNQTLLPDEIIIVNDFSSRDEFEKLLVIVKKFNKKIHLNIFSLDNNKGPSYCRNYGVKNSKGRLIFFLDADDEWHSNKVSIHYNNYKNNKIDAIYDNQYSKRRDILEKINFKIISNNFCENMLRGWGPPNLSSLSIRKDIFFKIGLLDSNLRYSEDQDLFIRFEINNVRVKGLTERLTFFSDEDKSRVSYSSVPRIEGTIDFLNKWEQYFKSNFPDIDYMKYRKEYIAKFTYILVINEIKKLKLFLASHIFIKYLLFNSEFYIKIFKKIIKLS